MDVCLKVTNVFDYGHGIKIKADWWNMAYVESFPLGFGYTHRVNLAKYNDDKSMKKSNKSYIGDWEILLGEPPLCIRYGNWKDIKE